MSDLPPGNRLGGADGHVAVRGVVAFEHRSDPLLEGSEFKLASAPSGLGRRQEIVVLLEPEVEVPIWIEAKDGLPQEPLQLD